MFQKIDPLPRLFFSAAAGVERGNQSFLEHGGQALAFGMICVKYLSAAVLGHGEIILMDAYEDGIVLTIHDSDPFFQIRNLFLSDGFPFYIYGGVGFSDHNGIPSKQMQQILQPQRDFQIDCAFQNSGAGGCATVFSAMPRVDDHTGSVLILFVCGKNFNRSVSQKNAQKG